MLQQHNVETAGIERKLERAGGLKRHLPALSSTLRQITRGIDECLAEIDARNVAAEGCGQRARRSTNARANVQNRHTGGDPDQLR